MYAAVYFPFFSPIHHLGSRPDAVFWSNLYFFGKDVPGIRQTVFVHDLRSLRYPETSYSKELWMTKAAVRRLRRSRCRIVTPSGWTKNDVAELAGIERGSHSRRAARHRPIVSGHCRPRSARRRRGPAGPGRQAFYLLRGRVPQAQEPAHAAPRVSRLRRRGGQDVLLVLAGDHPPYLEQIFQESEYDEADRAAVRYLGFISDDDLVALYNLALCLAFPSRNEGFGLPITEAMACGCPVAASSATALPEVCGGAAILVDPTDTAAWTAALATIVGDGALAASFAKRAWRGPAS